MIFFRFFFSESTMILMILCGPHLYSILNFKQVASVVSFVLNLKENISKKKLMKLKTEFCSKKKLKC